MKKILLITYYFLPKIGGGEEYLYNIYKRLPVDKAVVLAHDRRNESQKEFDEIQKFKIYRADFFSGKFKPTWLPMIKLVKKIVRNEKVEVIHFGHYAHYILLARILKMPYLVYVQGSDLSSYTISWFGKLLAKPNLKKAKKIIANSQFLKDRVAKLGVSENKIEVVYPGLNLDDYDFNCDGGICEFQSCADKKIILSVGRLVYSKGFDLVINSLPKVIEKISNAVYVIVGDGTEKENLKNSAKKLGVSNQVIFAGEIRDKKELSRYYASADLFAGPSRSEGFGIVFLEARAFGLPIVATDVGGIREAVGDRGALVGVNDVDGLAQNIIKILSQAKKHQPEVGFGWEEKAEKLKLIFE